MERNPSCLFLYSMAHRNGLHREGRGMLSYLYTKTILYKHFTNLPFLILHSPFMIITVDKVNNKKKNYCTRQKEITKMKLKKFIAMMAVTVMVAGMATGCGG